jgi:phosphoserine phosphatase
MHKKIIVFDFDKTLTYEDTLLEFYIYCSKKNIKFPLKILIYFFLMIFFKLKLVSNDYLKLKGFNVFLRGLKVSYLEDKAKKFASRIKFNELYKSYNFNIKDKRIVIISASYELYLKYIFSNNVEILGTTFNSDNGIAKEFNFNCYSTNKIFILNKNGIININTFYTDSYSDKSVAEISNEVIIVNKNKLIKCKSINEFDLYFKK